MAVNTQTAASTSATDIFQNAASHDGTSVAMPVNSPFTLLTGADAKRDGINANANVSDGEFSQGTSATAGDSLRRARLRTNKESKGTQGPLAFIIASGTSRLSNYAQDIAIQDDATRDAINTLTRAAGYAAAGLGGMSLLNKVLFGAEAAMTAAEGAKVAKNAVSGRVVGEVVEETAEAAARTGTRVAATAFEEAAEAGGSWLGRGLLRGLKFAKRIPIVGAVVTAGFVGAEVYSLRHDWDQAAAAFAVGAAEVAGNVVPFGGDVAREFALAAAIAYDEDNRVIMTSDVRMLVETGIDVAQGDIQLFTTAPVPAMS